MLFKANLFSYNTRNNTTQGRGPLENEMATYYSILDTRTSLHGQYINQNNYILCSYRRRSSTQSAKTRPGADCGSDHEQLIAKYRLKLKKVRKKTTRPLRFDLNQILYDYTVQFSLVQSLSHIWLFGNPWTTARQALLSISNSKPRPSNVGL